LEAQKIDVEFLNYLGNAGIPFCIIFTKADKLNRTKAEQNIAAYKKVLLAGDWEEFPTYFLTSSETGVGQDDVLNFIDQVNTDFFKSQQEFI